MNEVISSYMFIPKNIKKQHDSYEFNIHKMMYPLDFSIFKNMFTDDLGMSKHDCFQRDKDPAPKGHGAAAHGRCDRPRQGDLLKRSR